MKPVFSTSEEMVATIVSTWLSKNRSKKSEAVDDFVDKCLAHWRYKYISIQHRTHGDMQIEHLKQTKGDECYGLPDGDPVVENCRLAEHQHSIWFYAYSEIQERIDD